MDLRSSSPQRQTIMMIAILWALAPSAPGWSLDITEPPPTERRETVSLADAAVHALQHNLDITVSRHTKESRLFDITVEQAKFDPTLSVNGQYNRTVNPLNRPVFGGTGASLGQITTFDQRSTSLTFDASTNLITGGNFDVNYAPSRSSINQNVARGFLFIRQAASVHGGNAGIR